MPGQEWAVNAYGGFNAGTHLMHEVRMLAQNQCRFKQLVKPTESVGPHMGSSARFTKTGKVETGGQAIGEHDDVPVTRFRIYDDSVTFTEYTNSIEWTWWVDLLSELSIKDEIVEVLTTDYVETMDAVIANEFQTADIIYTPTGTTSSKTYSTVTNGTVTATSTRAISAWDIKNIVDLMRSTYKMPAFANNHYICICTTAFTRGLKDDPEWIDAHRYAAPENLITGEVGMYNQVRFVEENNTLNNSFAGGLGEAIFCAQDPVVEVEIYPLEFQTRIPDKYGRGNGIRWVNVVGYQKTWDYSAESHERILRVASAA